MQQDYQDERTSDQKGQTCPKHIRELEDDDVKRSHSVPPVIFPVIEKGAKSPQKAHVETAPKNQVGDETYTQKE